MSARPFRLLASFLTVGGWTLVSRVLGFVRDILIAAFLGTGALAEAFFIAFALPNMFRRFFAEGAFNTAFVPMFSKRVEAGEGAHQFARDAFSALALVLIVLTVLAQVFMPWLVWATASGFQGDERFDLAVGYGRIVFPYIFFISLAALLSGVLNATGRFAAAAAAPVLLNVILIGAMILADLKGGGYALALSYAVPVAGIAQMALVWLAASRAGFRLIPRLPRMTPELKRLMIIAGPAALAMGVVQINLVVGRQVASQFEHAVGWLSYADRIYQLPLGLVGIAIGIVLLPELSRRLQADDTAGGRDAFNRSAEFALFLTLPASVALIIIPEPIVSVLFGRGAFRPEDASATAAALAIYGIGLPAFVLQKLLMPVFFAREDTRRPFYYALVSMLVNLGVAVGLMSTLGYLAAAWGVTLAAWVQLGLLWYGSRGLGEAVALDAELKHVVPRVLGACGLMAIGLIILDMLLSSWLDASGLRYVALGALVAAGGAFYAIAAILFGAVNLRQIKSAFMRRS